MGDLRHWPGFVLTRNFGGSRKHRFGYVLARSFGRGPEIPEVGLRRGLGFVLDLEDTRWGGRDPSRFRPPEGGKRASGSRARHGGWREEKREENGNTPPGRKGY